MFPRNVCYKGAWTRFAEVLCNECLADPVGKPVAVTPGPATTCDRCGRRIVIAGRDDVMGLNNLRHAINARIPGTARMDQTGGMCAAVHITLPVPPAYLMAYDDDESALGRYCIAHFADEDAEGDTIKEGLTLDESVMVVAVELGLSQVRAFVMSRPVDPAALRRDGLAALDVDHNLLGGADVTTDVHGDYFPAVRALIDAILRGDRYPRP